MPDDGLPDKLADLTSARLSALLGRAVTVGGCAALDTPRAFTGAQIGRLTLAGQAPLIAKLSPADPVLRHRLAAANAREAAFYARLADVTPMAPKARFAAAAPDGRSLILLPDLSGHAAVSLAAGCPPDRAAQAVRALAAIHARHWGAAPALPCVDIAAEFGFAALWPGFRAAQPDLPPGLRALGDRIAGQGMAAAPGPLTLTHGDAQVENLLFGPDGAAVWIDWQMAGWGAGAADLGYFLISSVEPADRRGLVALWCGALAAEGVTAPEPAALARALDHGLARKLVLTVVATQCFNNDGEARAAYRRADLARLIAFAADMGIASP